jgi:hypothetical protein
MDAAAPALYFEVEGGPSRLLGGGCHFENTVSAVYHSVAFLKSK